MWNPCEEVTMPSQSWYFQEKKKKAKFPPKCTLNFRQRDCRKIQGKEL